MKTHITYNSIVFEYYQLFFLENSSDLDHSNLTADDQILGNAGMKIMFYGNRKAVEIPLQ